MFRRCSARSLVVPCQSLTVGSLVELDEEGPLMLLYLSPNGGSQIECPHLLVLEQLALHDRMDNTAHPILVGLRRIEGFLNLSPVRKPHRGAGGEDR